jgi:hypothetical protein
MLGKVALPQLRGFPSIQILWRPFSEYLSLEFCVISQKVMLTGFARFLTFATILESENPTDTIESTNGQTDMCPENEVSSVRCYPLLKKTE